MERQMPRKPMKASGCIAVWRYMSSAYHMARVATAGRIRPEEAVVTARSAAAASRATAQSSATGGKRAAARTRSAATGRIRAVTKTVAAARVPAVAPRGGKISKVSVSMRSELAKSVRDLAGPGQFSSYVSDAVERKLALDRLAAYVAEFEEDLGRPIGDELMAEAEAAWHGE
jgi:hypothetical protein